MPNTRRFSARHASLLLNFSLPLLIGLSLLLAAACDGSSSPPPATPEASATPAPPENTPTPAPTATPVPPTATPRVPDSAVAFPPAQRESALRLMNEVASAWGAPARGEPEMFLINRASATRYYAPAPRDPNATAPPRSDPRSDLYKLLGMVPERTDVGQSDSQYLGGLITGFYSSELDAFYLLDDQGPPDGAKAKATVVHEFTHVLQDQYYDLDAVGKTRDEDWDGTRTFLSVLEGDALTTEAHFFGRPLRQIPSCFTLPAVPSSTPYAIARDLDTWYFDGYCFFQAMGREGLKPADIWKDLPTTTEQLLHPEKYLAKEGARPVTLPSITEALGAGWKRQEASNFGEYGLQNLLQAGLSRDFARIQRAAAGWGGDAWNLYENGDARLLQAATVWDTPEDALEFFEALSASMRSRTTEFTTPSETRAGAVINGRQWRASLNGDRVDFVVGTEADAVERVAAVLKL